MCGQRSLLPVLLAAWVWMPALRAAEPIHLHAQNPHYFVFRGKPTLLVTATEHYGAVINLDFDYVRYLDTLQACGFNLTRTFSGTYREVPGSFRITGNTLAPAPGRFCCPWARAAEVEERYDLARWDAHYFDRLKDFVSQAGQRGIVVELVLFCTMYDDRIWGASPMNAANNINGVGRVGRHEVYSGRDPGLLAAQRSLVRKIVTELQGFDNLYYEICNEPYERPGWTREWNDAMITAILEAEAGRSAKHLIAQNVAPGGTRDIDPRVSVVNFHSARPDAARESYALNRVLACDETGGADRSDRKYRTDGWRFLLAGGAVYNHLDFSFTPDHEDGTAVPLPASTPGGGGPELRRQLQILKQFLDGYAFWRMAPNDGILRSKNISGVLPAEAAAGGAAVQVLAEVGRAYAIYVCGGVQAELELELPAGNYVAEWVDTRSGAVTGREVVRHSGGTRTLVSPRYREDIALRIQRHERS